SQIRLEEGTHTPSSGIRLLPGEHAVVLSGDRWMTTELLPRLSIPWPNWIPQSVVRVVDAWWGGDSLRVRLRELGSGNEVLNFVVPSDLSIDVMRKKG